MFRVTRLGTALGLALAGTLAAPPLASSAQQTEEELLGRLEALREPLEEARVAAEAAAERRELGRARRDRAPTDTVQVGAFRVVTLRDQAELARELFAEVRREDYGNVSRSPGLEERLFTFQWSTRLRNIHVEPQGPPTTRIELYRFALRTREAVKARIRDAVGAALLEDLPWGTPLREWAWRPGAAPDFADVYRMLAVEPSEANRACLAGDVGACRAALGLGIDDDGSLAAWFTPEERRRLVARNSSVRSLPLDRDDPVMRRCYEDHDVAACDEILRNELTWMRLSTAPSPSHLSLLWYAVRRGGEGAWERLMEGLDAHPLEALAYASGMDADALLASWRAAVVESRPQAYAGIGATRWTVFFWILILAALAMRSTRWRLA